MATHRQGSAEAKPPRRKATGAKAETTRGEHNAYEVGKVEPAGLPAFGANPITVPSLTTIPVAVVPPEADSTLVDPIGLGTLADPLSADPPSADPLSADPPSADPLSSHHLEVASPEVLDRELPRVWPFAEPPTAESSLADPADTDSDSREPDLRGTHSRETDSRGTDSPGLGIFDRRLSGEIPEDDPLGLWSDVTDLPAADNTPFEPPPPGPPAGPPTAHPAHGRNELGLDADIAAHWDLWSAQIGRALMPTLRELGRSMHGFSCAMICTADGFNLCTLGVDEAGVLRLAALTSSMHSMADAVTQAVHGDTERRLDLLTLTDQTSTIVVLAIRDLIIGKLLLWVATEEETLGALLVRSRLAAAQVRQLLHVDES